MNKFNKVVVLDSVIFYPEHRKLLNDMAREVVEYPASIPDALEKQYIENPEIFKNKKCYTQIATDDIPTQLLADRIDGADVIISCWTDIPDEILKINPQLKLIVFWTHEKEHRINMKLADKMGVTVTNVPDYGTDSVAEVVFAGLEELLLRNHSSKQVESVSERIHAILAKTFQHFRKLDKNEKYTRSGKFLHHFHKLGMVKWDFAEKELEQLVPEKLIENKCVGLLNISNEDTVAKNLEAFNLLVQSRKCTTAEETDDANFYKFMSENTLVFFDSEKTPDNVVAKCGKMFGEKLLDIRSLATSQYEFAGKQFGIVGLGRIGKRVAGIAKELGFDVVYYSRTRNKDEEKKLNIKYIPLEKLMRTSDIVSVHVSAHKAENLINERLINLMKNGLVFINTADGNAINQKALSKRMSTGGIYAYLDVYPGLPRKDILGVEMKDKNDWKINNMQPNNVFAYRAGWKTQESIRVKTYKLLGEMADFLISEKAG